jgi:site-specific recombinase XerD
MNIKLAQWVLKAGLTKTITFHCARHTNAVLLLSNGVGIETVSKMLGHRDLKTTQIYAKVVDEMKQRAVNLIPQI